MMADSDIKPGDKVRIRQSIGIPGFGGLNFRSLREDGWEPEALLTVIKVHPDGSVDVSWGKVPMQRRNVWPNEIVAQTLD